MDTWLIFLAICVLLLCLILTIVVLIVYSGAFESIEVKAGKPPIGKVSIAYKYACGPYKEAGPLFFEVAKIAPDNRALAIYYDDPSQVEPHRQRYVVACILAEGEEEVDRELVKKFEAEGFKTMDLPLVDYAVHSFFPYKCALSVFIGMQKIYPKMSEYTKEHGLEGHPFVEIYSGNTIYYMAPLDRQEDFYVPESLQKTGGEPSKSVDAGEPGLGINKEDSKPADTGSPEPASLLHPSQIVKAEVIGRVEEEQEQTAGEEEDLKQTAEEAEEREDSPDPESSPVGEETKKERASDEESGSSFEDLKLEAEEVCEKVQSL